MFGCSEVPFVGYLVNKDGILPLPEKVEHIANYEQPATVRDLRFLPKAAHIQAPLHDFLKNSKKNDKVNLVILRFQMHDFITSIWILLDPFLHLKDFLIALQPMIVFFVAQRHILFPI
ncbi:hypothetical protein TNCV_874291 [Trichonephila clavipes]|nr:hypothetical protein TNCV_874291 [Trichonephila clavipes]